MAGHHLIDDYLAALGRQLPTDTLDELADGLAETYQRYRSAGLDPDAAAHATIGEFGQPDTVLTAFVRHAPGRRVALMLLGTGPVLGLCWGASLISGRAWTWHIPIALRGAFAVALLAVIATLVLAASARRDYRRTRLTIGASLALLALDGAMVTSILLSAVPFVWPMALAIPASLTRMTLIARAVPALYAT